MQRNQGVRAGRRIMPHEAPAVTSSGTPAFIARDMAPLKRRAYELRAAGVPMRAIGLRLGVMHTTARRWAHEEQARRDATASPAVIGDAAS